MGCSVSELSGFHYAISADQLNSLAYDALTLCVTSVEQAASHVALEKAGFIRLVRYKNYASGHVGEECTLWGRVNPKNKAEFLPSKIKTATKKGACYTANCDHCQFEQYVGMGMTEVICLNCKELFNLEW